MKNPSERELAALRQRAGRIAAALPPVRREQGRLSPESREAFRKAAARVLRHGRAVGASLVLVREEAAEVFCFGQARLRPRLPVTPETCFRVASVSKLALSLLCLALCEDGLLSLDGDVSPLLGFRTRNPRRPGTPVTMRMLLTHTAGLSDRGPYLRLDPSDPPALSRLLRDPGCWLDRDPGEGFCYSNLGAGAAGVALERLTGKPLDELMRERLFRPLGMRAALDPAKLPVSDLASGYRVYPLLPPLLRYDAARTAAGPPARFDPDRDVFAAAGRMRMDSAAAASLLRLCCARADTPALSLASLREMRVCQDGRGGIRSAGRTLGAARLPGVFPGFDALGHQGVAYGMCAEFFFDPERRCGVCLMTSGLALERRAGPLIAAGFDALALGFAALGR